MRQEAAEILALEALRWLAGHDELLPVFVGASGASLDDLKGNASDPAVLASVLDFVMLDDAWVLAFSAETGRRPEDVGAARAQLPGGDAVHWT